MSVNRLVSIGPVDDFYLVLCNLGSKRRSKIPVEVVLVTCVLDSVVGRRSFVVFR